MSKPISPIKEGGDTTVTKFIKIDGQDVKMVVDISLDGNTGTPKFTQLKPDQTNNFLQSLTRDFTVFPKEKQFSYQTLDKKIKQAIIEDENNVVKNAYEEAIEEANGKIVENGNDTTAFTESLLDNNNSTFEGAIENSFKKDFNNDGFIGGIDTGTDNQPEVFKAPQVTTEDLVYPLDMKTGENDDQSQDYIFIEQFAYLPPNPIEAGALTDRGAKLPGNEEINTLPQVVEFGVRRSNNVNIKERFGSCKLPIPNKLGVSDGVSWGEARANSVELAGFNAANSSIRGQLDEFNPLKIPGQVLSVAGDTLNELKKDTNNPDPNNPDAGSILSATLAKAVLSQLNINVDIDQFITRQTGAAINPNLELLFGGPRLRTFSFAFDFAPNGEEEAEEVRKIQRWFKQGMLPSRSGATGARPQSLFLGSPNVFRIAYMNKSRRIKGLNIIKICALTSIQIDFTPDNTYQSYEDTKAFSQPVRSTMAVTFNELTPIFRDDYAAERTGFVRDPSLEDLGTNITGDNEITDSDIGF